MKVKVKIGNKIHDSNNEPIMLILEEQDKEDIANMNDDDTCLCSFPLGWDIEDIERWKGEG